MRGLRCVEQPVGTQANGQVERIPAQLIAEVGETMVVRNEGTWWFVFEGCVFLRIAARGRHGRQTICWCKGCVNRASSIREPVGSYQRGSRNVVVDVDDHTNVEFNWRRKTTPKVFSNDRVQEIV